ncbi:MAG: hypothetical protein V1809_04225 [Planctomycetota bacterium]
MNSLLFEKAGPERVYGKVGGAPAVLLRVALSTPDWARGGETSPGESVPVSSRTLSPLFHPESEELGILAPLRRDIRPLHAGEFIRLFLEETDVWAKAGPDQRAHLRARYVGWRRAGADARTPGELPAERPDVLENASRLERRCVVSANEFESRKVREFV